MYDLERDAHDLACAMIPILYDQAENKGDFDVLKNYGEQYFRFYRQLPLQFPDQYQSEK